MNELQPGHGAAITNDVAIRSRIHGLALCAGTGGIELGLKLALRGHYRCVGYVEREAYAASVLVARMEDKALDSAPVWDDLETFDGRPWRGKVDIVTSGLPCQPYSVAGARRGHEDERALWPGFVRIVRECEPALVFIENVPEFLKHFEPIWDELCGLGFDFAPPALFTAEEIGAPHIRRRLFILAARPDRLQLRKQPGRCSRACGAGAALATELGAASHPDRAGLEGPRLAGCERADERASEASTSDSWTGSGANGRSFWGQTQPPPFRVDDGSPTYVDELRAIGNGVVPQVVAEAFRWLVSRIEFEACAEQSSPAPSASHSGAR